MNELYAELAEVYEAMYDTFINYLDEYQTYSQILDEAGKKSLMELGCGTGNLAKHFQEAGFQYQGLDFSPQMINLAQKKNPDSKFRVGDMRNFQLKERVSGVLMAGRTISYLLRNQDLNATFSSVWTNLEPGGIFCFDFIDANQFMPTIASGKTIQHEARYQNTDFVRDSTWNLLLEHGMDFKWDSIYYKRVGEELVEMGRDNSIIRTFTKDEIEIFLKINQFKLSKTFPRESYAFPTYVAVAEKG